MADNTDNKKSTYNYEAQKRYNAKSMHIGLKFVEGEKDFYDQINMVCSDKNCSKQNYIKTAIREKLERDGYIEQSVPKHSSSNTTASLPRYLL